MALVKSLTSIKQIIREGAGEAWKTFSGRRCQLLPNCASSRVRPSFDDGNRAAILTW